MIRFVENSRWALLVSLLIIIAGIVSMSMGNLNLGIDFTGGTLIQVKIGEAFTDMQVREVLAPLGLEGSKIQHVRSKTGEADEVVIRTAALDEEERQAVIAALQERWPQITNADILRVDNVGAVIGGELTRSAMLALALAALGMVVYITFRFEFSFAIAAIIALLHDALIVFSVFFLFQVEINSPFVAAILTIIGYSINDTIVIYDRIRENLKRYRRQDLVTIVNRSLTETLSRSINTSATTLLVLFSLVIAFYFFVGAMDLQAFILALLVGVISGTYSSVFIAAPIWVFWRQRGLKLQPARR